MGRHRIDKWSNFINVLKYVCVLFSWRMIFWPVKNLTKAQAILMDRLSSSSLTYLECYHSVVLDYSL